MFPGTSTLRSLSLYSSTLRNVTSKFAFVVDPQVSCCHRGIHRSVVCLSDSKRDKDDTDGFVVENLDTESKEKLSSLKNVLLKNSYFEKYKEKIVQAQRTYPKEFLSLLEGLKTSKTKSVASDYVPKMSSQTKQHQLEEVMKVNLLMELERDDVSYIWQEYHHKKGLIAACMQCTVFERILNRATLCNTFVLPLDRKQGHDFHVVQFSNNSFYFTPLVSWQAYKENSPVTLALHYYDELKDKDVVLMRGEFDKNTLSQKDAQELALQIHFYYAEPDIIRSALLEKFVSDPAGFQHTDLIAELSRMKENHKELFGIANEESTDINSS